MKTNHELSIRFDIDILAFLCVATTSPARAGASNPLFSPAAGTLPYATRADRECQLVTEIEQQVGQIKSDLDEILREAKKRLAKPN